MEKFSLVYEVAVIGGVECDTGQCAICDAYGAISERIEVDQFTYGSGDQAVIIVTKVPVTWCSACGEGYTGEEAEIIRANAVRRHLESLDVTS